MSIPNYYKSNYKDAFQLLLVTKRLPRNVFKTFQKDWTSVEMWGFLLVVYKFFLTEFQLVFIQESQQLKSNIKAIVEDP